LIQKKQKIKAHFNFASPVRYARVLIFTFPAPAAAAYVRLPFGLHSLAAFLRPASQGMEKLREFNRPGRTRVFFGGRKLIFRLGDSDWGDGWMVQILGEFLGFANLGVLGWGLFVWWKGGFGLGLVDIFIGIRLIFATAGFLLSHWLIF